MGLYKQYTANEYQWGIWKVTENLNELLSLLPEGGAAYEVGLNTFRSDSRKIEWLAVRVLLYALTGEVNIIAYHANGRPFLADHKAYISISHTKGYVAVILSTTHEVGIDIEKMGERVHKVAHKFVRDDEKLPDDPFEKTQALLLIWSAKEVIFKCMNQQDVDFREHMHIELSGIDQTPFYGKETRTPEKHTYLIHHLLHPDFVMTWTVIP